MIQPYAFRPYEQLQAFLRSPDLPIPDDAALLKESYKLESSSRTSDALDVTSPRPIRRSPTYIVSSSSVLSSLASLAE